MAEVLDYICSSMIQRTTMIKSLYIINPIQDRVTKRTPSTSFSPVTSTNVGISPWNFLTFTFNPFVTLVSNFKAIPSVSHHSLKKTPQKNWFFWSNLYKIEVLITSLMEMLELPNVIWPHLQHNLSHVINFCWWHHRHNLWRHNLYFKIPLFQEGLG